MFLLPINMRQITSQIIVHDAIIIFCIMPYQHIATHKVEKHLQAFLVRTNGLVLALADDWIGDIAQHLGNFALGIDMNRELVHGLAVSDALGRNLNHIIIKHVQSGGFGVEHHYLLLIIDAQKLLYIGRILVIEEVGRCDAAHFQPMNELPRGGIALENHQSLEQSRPCQEVVLVGQHAQLSHDELHFRCGKEVGARHLEMGLRTLRQFLANHVGIVVGIHDDGCGFIGIVIKKA